MQDPKELTILVTGATDGLGLKVATDLARNGSTLLLHGRDQEKGERVLAQMRDQTCNARLHYLNADLGSLAQVRRLAAAVAGRDRLDVLINNAGIGGGPDPKRRETSADGFELRFAINYLAHFLLTRMLLPLLCRTAQKAGMARIVNVSSAAQQAIDFGDVMLEKSYSGMAAYSQSKLAQIMFTFDLAEELTGTGVAVNALHPASLMDTNLVRAWFASPRTSVEKGAHYVERLAVAPELDGVSGVYFDKDRPSRADGQAYEEKLRQRLRELSLRWTALEAGEKRKGRDVEEL